MTTIIDSSKRRLVKYLTIKGISASDFYRTTGLKRGLIDNDKLSQQLSSDKIAIIIENYKDLNVEWLITGEGEMIKTDSFLTQNTVNEATTPYNKIASTTNDIAVNQLHHPKYIEGILEEQFIPLLSFEATAGVVEMLDTSPQYIIDKIYVPNSPKCDGAIRVTGDSMYPLLKSGDIVAFKKILDFQNIHYGDMYILG